MNAMQNNGGRLRNYSMAWAPATPPPARRPAMGQAASFIESPLLALFTDSVAAGSAAFLAWGLGLRNNKWSTFWWVVAAGAVMKGLHDMSRISSK